MKSTWRTGTVLRSFQSSKVTSIRPSRKFSPTTFSLYIRICMYFSSSMPFVCNCVCYLSIYFGVCQSLFCAVLSFVSVFAAASADNARLSHGQLQSVLVPGCFDNLGCLPHLAHTQPAFGKRMGTFLLFY